MKRSFLSVYFLWIWCKSLELIKTAVWLPLVPFIMRNSPARHLTGKQN